MNSYLVQPNNPTPKLGSFDEVKDYHQANFFDQLLSLAKGSNGQVDVVNTLLLTGVAIVDATDDGVEMMKRAGYQVTPNGVKRAI